MKFHLVDLVVHSGEERDARLRALHKATVYTCCLSVRSGDFDARRHSVARRRQRATAAQCMVADPQETIHSL